jgi:hypothetical protein
MLTDELKRYEYKITANGNITYNAPGGYHDDCVIALALANSERYQFKWTGARAGVGRVTHRRLAQEMLVILRTGLTNSRYIG